MNPTEPIIEDVYSSTIGYIWRNAKLYLFGLVALVVVSIYSILLFGVDPRFAIIPLMAALIGYGIVQKKIKRQFTIQFGASIGFSYVETGSMDSVSGDLFSFGHSRSIYDVLTGTHDGLPMRIFSYRFTVGSGKSSHTYSYTVFEVCLNNDVPEISLYSKGHQGAISDMFSGNETIDLEGDFSQYFRLRVPKGHGLEVYQIFTPDVMAYLIDHAHEYSFDFSGKKLYIYAPKLIFNRKDLEAMFGLVTYIDNMFRKNADGVNHIEQVDLKK